jgi:hypothetical protein
MRRMIGVGVGVAACALLGASPASAILTWPQQMGDRCAATGAAGQTAIILNNSLSGADLPIAAPPETASVITHWTVDAPAGIGPIAEQLVAFRQVGPEGSEDQPIGESALETVVGGAANEFSTRIPVPEYARIGLRGPAGALICAAEPLHLAGLATDTWATGEARPVQVEVNTGVPVLATLEPDRDHDGYGDETQDECPEQPLVHTACPFVRLVPTAKAFRRGILVEVSTGDPTKVEVSGQVGWGYRPRDGGPRKQLIVGLSSAAQEVGAGATVPFWLPLPKTVLGRLAKLTPKEKLKAHLSIVATDVVGHQTNRAMGVRLPGRAKRRPARPSR